MIDSVKQVVTVKAIDLPPTFDVRVGNVDYPFEIQDSDSSYIYLLDTSSGEVVYVRHNDILTVLVPDTWDNAKWDIGLSLMNQGIL